MFSHARASRWSAGFAFALGLLLGAPSRAHAQTPTFHHAHGGNIFKAWITADGSQIWAAEDGGRIRRGVLSTPTAPYTWTFQDSGSQVKDQVLSLMFLEDITPTTGPTGWYSAMNGWFGWTTNGGTAWHHYQLPSKDELWDVWFTDADNGFLVARHGVFRTTNGAIGGPADWIPVLLLDKNGVPIDPQLDPWFFYGLDVQLASSVASPPPNLNVVGLLCASPGVIFRNIDADGWVWQIVYDVRDDLCGTNDQPRCMNSWCANPTGPGIPFYDVAISRSPGTPLGLVVGGGAQCGLIVATDDHGLTWRSERHECCLSNLNTCPDCSGDPAYNPATPIHRLDSLLQLYSVALWDGDNTAVVSGYSGQHLLRDTTGVWRDRSVHTNDVIANPQAVITPMYGTAADEGTSSEGKGIISGAGGYLRFTENGGATWNDEHHPDWPAPTASPYRLRGVHFVTDTIGFVVGQWFRIAKTGNGGYTWDNVIPNPTLQGNNLLAITFSPDGKHGVAVGEPPNSAGPKILWTESFPNVGAEWHAPSVVLMDQGTTSTDKALRAVAWAGNQTFWAGGQTGLIYKSQDGGDQWQQFVPPDPSWSSFEIEGVAFRDQSTGIFVGSILGVASAFLYLDGSPITWAPIGPASGTLNFTRIHGVALDASGGKAYAVATAFDATSGEEYGVLLVKDGIDSTNSFVATGLPQPACTIGDELELTPIFNAITVAPGGTAWFGGECGRVFSYSGTGPIIEHKSETDAHIRGISFPSPDVGVCTCLRQGRTGWSVVRRH